MRFRPLGWTGLRGPVKDRARHIYWHVKELSDQILPVEIGLQASQVAFRNEQDPGRGDGRRLSSLPEISVLVAVGAVEPAGEKEGHTQSLSANRLISDVSNWADGTNIPGKPVGLIFYGGGFKAYCDLCDEVASKGYEGFELT